MEEIFKLVGNYGFPMVVAGYLLVRLEPLIRSLDRSVAVLTAVIERQCGCRPEEPPGGGTGSVPAAGTAGWPLVLDGRQASGAGGRNDDEAPGPGPVLYAGGPEAETGANDGPAAGVLRAQAELRPRAFHEAALCGGAREVV